MKNPFLHFPDIKGHWEPKLWLLYHLGLPTVLVITVFLIGPLSINTSLQEMLPKSTMSKAAAQAENILGEKSSRQAVILAASENFNDAKKGAQLLYEELKKSADFDEISFYYDSKVIAEFAEFLHEYRFVIAGRETQTLLETGRAGEIAEGALAAAFGAFTFTSLDSLETDPFLLAGRRMEEFISSPLLSMGSLAPKDDVLAAFNDGKWNVMLRASLSPDAASVAGKNSGIFTIFKASEEIKETMNDLNFYFSGVPFHSYESSVSAQREISIIGTITFLLILAMFIYIFRSAVPVIYSMLAIVFSLIMALTGSLLIFREIHIISFVLGTTLIGICNDYSAHFFIQWKGNPALKKSTDIRSYLLKTLTVCFVSTEICFSVFLFSPFPILKQFAVFCMAGLLSSFLTPVCLYSYLEVPPENKRKIKFISGKLYQRLNKISVPFFLRAAVTAALVVYAALILFFHPSGLKIENNVASLYTMSDSLLESEIHSAQILDYGSRFWYFIVSGSSPEETLENEEKLVLRLEEEIRLGNLGSILGTTVFVPSKKTQDKTYKAMSELLPLAQTQYNYLGFPSGYAGLFYEEFKAGKKYCLPEDAPSLTGLSNLWIGESGGNYFSCVMPLNAADEEIFKSIAEEFEFVYFINKAKDISRDLDTLTKTMLLFFLAAFVLISVIIFFIYPWRDCLKICLIPVCLVICTWAVLTANRIPMSFFPAAALVLVFGLGLDYIFFMLKRKSPDKFILLAVILSSLTTILTFGVLSFSSFLPVHMFGLTVLVGITAAFIFAMLLHGKKDSENQRISG